MRQRKYSFLVQCSVDTALIWFILVAINLASIPLYGLLLVLNSAKFPCSCTSIQPKTFRVLALAFNNDAKSQALLYHGLYLELDVLSSTQTN